MGALPPALALDRSGTVVTLPHDGHMSSVPARRPSDSRVLPQLAQRYLITPIDVVSRSVTVAWSSVVAMALTESRWLGWLETCPTVAAIAGVIPVLATGISIPFPHLGHLPLRPALSSATQSTALQFEQLNAIMPRPLSLLSAQFLELLDRSLVA